MQSDVSYGQLEVAHIVATGDVHHHRLKSKPLGEKDIIPRMVRTESGRVGEIERFSHYVARQMGFSDPDECPQLCKLAYHYLKKGKGFEDRVCDFFVNEPNPESLCGKLIQEFEKCILSYFAFHWDQASLMITQVLNVQSEPKTQLKDLILAATRKRRFETVMRNLKTKGVFCTLMEEMKTIKPAGDESHCTEAAQSERSPVLLLMGGGMGAGKSTVLKEILKEHFWSEAAAKAVVVEADAFKERDVIYKTLSSRGHHDDMLQTAELVHQSSTDAASSVLVTALNEGRDVIMDGTLSWAPFVEQTIAMARNVHKCRYRMGVGYKVAEDGTITENYWEQVKEGEEEEEGQPRENGEAPKRKPYRIELVGVVCDAYLAVVRGIRRAIIVGRAVRVNSQLKSHKRFVGAFPRYCPLVDSARLYYTNALGGPPKVTQWKDGDIELQVDPEDVKCLTTVSSLNPDAKSIYELYSESSSILEPDSIWNAEVLSPERASLQRELRACIQRIEKKHHL